MAIGSSGRRHVKGVNLIGLVKMLKVYRRQQPLDELSSEASALLDDRILASSWYPLPVQLELLDVTYRRMLGQNPDHALAMGLAGGREIWSGPHRAFIAEQGPVASLRAMVPAWANYFDFGSLAAEEVVPGQIQFTVDGYPDVPVCHGMTIAGWHLAAAQLGGAPDATVEVLARPWEGASQLIHVVRF